MTERTVQLTQDGKVVQEVVIGGPMNERNVVGLYRIIQFLAPNIEQMLKAGPLQEAGMSWIAAEMARHGVLVPDALTDEEVDGLASFAQGAVMDVTEDDDPPNYKSVRQRLEDFAKGE